MTVFPQSLFSFVCSYLMSFTLFTTRHINTNLKNFPNHNYKKAIKQPDSYLKIVLFFLIFYP